MKMKFQTFRFALLASVLSVAAARADTGNVNMADIYSLPVASLADLDYTVTSAAKREEKLLDTAAAMYVVTADDIRRSGATSIPEALRDVPGLDVARLNAHSWAVSSRGFNDELSNKLLVLIDGRSIYTPEFSGVLWDEQNIPMENIERIEVIRGPGATLWGANAVNGVINIITKNSKDMQGNLVSAGTGTIETALGTARHGGTFAEKGFYDVYASTTNDVTHAPFAGSSVNFSNNMAHTGFRTDWEANPADNLTVEGDVFHGNEHDLNINNPFNPSSYTDGGNLLDKWTHIFSPDSKLQLQAYIDFEDRQYNVGTQRSATYDVDLQHTYTGLARNEIVWGAGARVIDLNISGAPGYPFPITTSNGPVDTQTLHVFNAFFQDQYALIPKTWFLIFGSKLEENSFTGVEVEPSVRTLWKIDPTQSAWAAFSRAVRTPSAFENYFDITLGPIPQGVFAPPSVPVAVVVMGNPRVESEQEDAYEIGYRKELNRKASIDTTAFFNYYGNIESNYFGNPYFQDGVLVVPQLTANEYHARTFGVEVAPSWQVTDAWKLKGSYSLLRSLFEANSPADTYEYTERSSPEHQFNIISSLNLPHSVEFDNSLSYTGSLKDLAVPVYFSFNTRLGWKPFDDNSLELSLTGENLFNRQHVEFNTLIAPVTQTAIPIPQDIIARATCRF